MNWGELRRAQAAAWQNVIAPAMSGRGIVTSIYDGEFTSGWVLVSELARLKVDLPVEVWYCPGELSDEQMGLLTAANPRVVMKVLPDNVTGWAVKVMALIRTTLHEVLWIDSDNAPIRDPSFLFSDPDYVEKGSLFWRDVSGTDRADFWHQGSPVWAIFDVPWNDAEEFDSGQLLVDRHRCWPELMLTAHYNLNPTVYYQHVHGDKDTFRLAWQHINMRRRGGYIRQHNYLAADCAYGFMPYGPFHMGKPNPWRKWGGGSVMVQRDRDGLPLFNHRTIGKFKLDGENVFNGDVPNEQLYHDHVAALKLRLGQEPTQ